MVVALTQGSDEPVLSQQALGERIDFGLALGGERGHLGAIALQKGDRIRRPAAPIGRPSWPELWNQRRHAANDLPIDQVELPLGLAPGLFQS